MTVTTICQWCPEARAVALNEIDPATGAEHPHGCQNEAVLVLSPQAHFPAAVKVCAVCAETHPLVTFPFRASLADYLAEHG